jgi:multiple sugar transport system substrate-binding protein
VSLRLRITVGLLAAVLLGSGCGASDKPEITLTMWHNYGGQMKEVMDELVSEFNDTLGRDGRITIDVIAVSSSADLNEQLQMIARDDPGAPDMPDLVTAYPSMALTLTQAGLLAPIDLDEATAARYVPQFVAEGKLPDGSLYVFPVAKSTEVLFCNTTLFDRFAAATGASLESLRTFEGVAETAVEYHDWTDAQTPDVPGDGKTFFAADSWFNIAQMAAAQLGGDFVGPDSLNTTSASFDRFWDVAVPGALAGGHAVAEGYSSNLSKTGDIVCAAGSTAGVLFYGDTVTYPDNTQETVEYEVLPYPVFSGGRKVALQRGAGFVVARSAPERERAGVEFLSWFTEPAQNLRFVRATGYLPVTVQAFQDELDAEIAATEDPVLQRLLHTAAGMYADYDFVTAPTQANLSQLSDGFETRLRQGLGSGRERVLDGEAPDLVGGLLRDLF